MLTMTVIYTLFGTEFCFSCHYFYFEIYRYYKRMEEAG